MKLNQEWRALCRGVRSLDAQTTWVLISCIMLVGTQFILGDRGFFLREVLSGEPNRHRQLLSWSWWFLMQGVTGFVIPVVVLRGVFKRSLSEIGLGGGDWQLALTVAVVYVPLVFAGTWVLSDGADFQAQYPHLRDAVVSWRVFAIYHVLFLMYWIGWEYLWRGFVLFGTAHTFGLHAILVQAVPFALLHVGKPLPELALSVVGGVALGVLVWRCRSFWIAVPIHAFQMLLLDLWCVLRVRTGASGVGLDTFRQLLSG